MKYALFVLLMFPICLNAQDCKLRRTTDPYTKEVSLSTGFIQLDGASLSINADSRDIDLFFSMDAKEKCFGDESTVIVNFVGTKVKATLRNNGPVNCEGIFHLIYKNQANPPAQLQKLITQKIVSFQFIGNNKQQVSVNLSDEDQGKIIAKADCLMKEAKTLIKP